MIFNLKYVRFVSIPCIVLYANPIKMGLASQGIILSSIKIYYCQIKHYFTTLPTSHCSYLHCTWFREKKKFHYTLHYYKNVRHNLQVSFGDYITRTNARNLLNED